MRKAFDGKVVVTGKGSLFMTHFLKGGITEITNAAQAAKCDGTMLAKYHFKMIANRWNILFAWKTRCNI